MFILYLIFFCILAAWLLRKVSLKISIPLMLLAPQLLIFIYNTFEAQRLMSEDTRSGAAMLDVLHFTLGVPAGLFCMIILFLFRRKIKK